MRRAGAKRPFTRLQRTVTLRWSSCFLTRAPTPMPRRTMNGRPLCRLLMEATRESLKHSKHGASAVRQLRQSFSESEGNKAVDEGNS